MTATLFVRDMPADIKAAVIAAAADEGMNDYIVNVIATRFGVPFTPTGRSATVAPGPTGDVVLRLPASLHRDLAVEAARRNGTMRGIVIATLAHHFGMTVPSVARRPRTTAA